MSNYTQCLYLDQFKHQALKGQNTKKNFHNKMQHLHWVVKLFQFICSFIHALNHAFIHCGLTAAEYEAAIY